MGLSKKLTIAGIVLSSMIACKPNEYLSQIVKDKSIKTSGTQFTLITGDFNNDSRYPDYISSKGAGVTLTYFKKNKKEKTRLIYSNISSTNSIDNNFTSKIAGLETTLTNLEYISKGNLNDDDNYLDFIYSSSSEVTIFINDGYGNFSKKQTVYSKIKNNSTDRIVNTLVDDSGGLYLLICDNDYLLKFKSNYDGTFNVTPDTVYTFNNGEGNKIFSLSSGRFTQDNVKDILLLGIDGLFMLNRVDNGEKISYSRSKTLYVPKNDGIINENSMAAISLDREPESTSDNIKLDDILLVTSKQRIYFENNNSGVYRRGIITKYDFADNDYNEGIGLDSKTTTNGNIIVYVGTSKKINKFIIGPKE